MAEGSEPSPGIHHHHHHLYLHLTDSQVNIVQSKIQSIEVYEHYGQAEDGNVSSDGTLQSDSAQITDTISESAEISNLQSVQQRQTQKEQKLDNGSDSQQGLTRLSGSIVMFPDQPLCTHANVFRGLLKSDIFDEKEIAVKYLQNSQDNIEEAKILNALKHHPNVVQLFHAGVYNEGPIKALYLAMELCQPLNLYDRILQDRKNHVEFNDRKSISFSYQIVLGVLFIHDHKVVIRDLKPHNILLSHDKKHLKIADFGLSKQLQQGRSVTKNKGAGTDGYRAPETMIEDKIYLESDIYCLALVMYFIWSYGCHPFGEDHDLWNYRIKKDKNRDLSHLRINDKALAEELLIMMMKFDRKERPKARAVLEHCVFRDCSALNDSLDVPEVKNLRHQETDSQTVVEEIGDNSGLFGVLNLSENNGCSTMSGRPTETQLPGEEQHGILELDGPMDVDVHGDALEEDSECQAKNQQLDEGELDSYRFSEAVVMYRKQRLSQTSQVYRGVMNVGGIRKSIAIKHLTFEKRNRDEAEVLCKLGYHPNVVQIFECGEDNDPYQALYIAMELCKPMSVHAFYLERKKAGVPFDSHLSMEHTRQVVLGLDFLHNHQIIDGDLKPQNVFFSVDGKNLKIADYGLSKSIQSGRSQTKESSRKPGADGYRAPETYNNDVISQLSDIFSLALVFYFIWSYGCHPYGDDCDDWNSNIKKNRDRDLSQLKIMEKKSAENLLTWMLRPNPDQRPTTKQIMEHRIFPQ